MRWAQRRLPFVFGKCISEVGFPRRHRRQVSHPPWASARQCEMGRAGPDGILEFSKDESTRHKAPKNEWKNPVTHSYYVSPSARADSEGSVMRPPSAKMLFSQLQAASSESNPTRFVSRRGEPFNDLETARPQGSTRLRHGFLTFPAVRSRLADLDIGVHPVNEIRWVGRSDMLQWHSGPEASFAELIKIRGGKRVRLVWERMGSPRPTGFNHDHGRRALFPGRADWCWGGSDPKRLPVA